MTHKFSVACIKYIVHVCEFLLRGYKGRGSAGAHPSCHWVRGGVQSITALT